jgi:hypothetical protein
MGRKAAAQHLGLAGFLETTCDVVRHRAINSAINFVGRVIVTFVPGETHIVGSSARPHFRSPPGKWRLPDAEMMATGGRGDRFGHFVSKILPAPGPVQPAPGHGEAVFISSLSFRKSRWAHSGLLPGYRRRRYAAPPAQPAYHHSANQSWCEPTIRKFTMSPGWWNGSFMRPGKLPAAKPEPPGRSI